MATDVGIVGLGRMGMGMGARLADRGRQVYGFDTSVNRKPEAAECGIRWTESMSDLARKLTPPRVVWVVVPAGLQTQEAIDSASASLSSGDILIDGGNSFYRDTMRRASILRDRGITLLDAGVSGGIHGRTQGYCLMVGGDAEAYRVVQPVLDDLAPTKGYARVGGPGAGHFAKMVHNAIEYCVLQAYGEGFELLKQSGFDYDLAALADLWNHGSVIRSWLLDLTKRAFERSPELRGIRGWVEDRRGTLGAGGGNRTRRAHAADRSLADDALPLPPGRLVRRQAHRGPAGAVRRARGEGGLEAAG